MPRAAKPDALETYRAKRRFDETAEPRGGDAAKPGHAYLMQKHDARRLHYDLRLELDGVLLSWAVTRGPSYSTKDKRLAVRTEDHPLEYGNFEGTIPKGNYGGGTVTLWDKGDWEPVGDPRAGLEKGKLVFQLHGKRLRGRWGLIRMKPRAKETRENWLLIKEKDELANTNPDLLDTATNSIVTKRGLREIALSAEQQRQAGAARMPGFTPPMLATLVDTPPTGAGWLFEVKFDGYRAQIAAGGDDVKIFSRSGLDWTDRFPGVAKAAAALQLDGALIDSEITVLDATGRSDFPALVNALESGKGHLTCFAFDLLALSGKNLARQPLRFRRAALKQLLGKPAPTAVIQYSDDFGTGGDKAGAKLLEAARARGLEGIIAKRDDATYRGGRSGAWLKIKCRHEQEFLILGFSASETSRPFASLLVGVNEDGKIRFAGRIGTGFDDRTFARLAKLRDRYKTAKAPAIDIPKSMRRNVAWVKPELVANVAFAGWTGDQHIRHGSFLGLREDKAPAEVTRETPRKRGAMKDKIDGVTISHGDKMVYPDADISKSEIAAYLHNVAKLMMPYTKDRFITLVRAPSGPDHKTFYQRHPGSGFGDAWLHQAFINKDNEKQDYIFFKRPEALIAAVQMNVLEFHIWGSRIDKINQPDRIVFDLDPDPNVGFDAVKTAAFLLRDVLEALDLQSLPLLSGGKGVHVVVPIQRRYEWPVIKQFAANLAERLAADAPDKFVATMSKAKRAKKIFIDHFRNERGATAIAPYSPRARAGAPVAWPLDWDGLKTIDTASSMTIKDAEAAIAAGENGWAGYSKLRQTLKPAVLRSLHVDA